MDGRAQIPFYTREEPQPKKKDQAKLEGIAIAWERAVLWFFVVLWLCGSGSQTRTGRARLGWLPVASSRRKLLQRLRMQTQILLPRRLLLRVLLHPCFPTLARRGIAAGKRQSPNLGIRYRNLLVRILGIQPHNRLFERSARPAVEQIPLDLRPILARNGNVAAIVEGLLQSHAQFFFTRQLRDPSFQPLMRRPGRNLQRVGIHHVRVRRNRLRRSVVDMSAFFSCHEFSLEWNSALSS